MTVAVSPFAGLGPVALEQAVAERPPQLHAGPRWRSVELPDGMSASASSVPFRSGDPAKGEAPKMPGLGDLAPCEEVWHG